MTDEERDPSSEAEHYFKEISPTDPEQPPKPKTPELETPRILRPPDDVDLRTSETKQGATVVYWPTTTPWLIGKLQHDTLSPADEHYREAARRVVEAVCYDRLS